LHFLAKLGIMVIRDIERNDVEFICKTLGCRPVAHIDNFTADKLGHAGVAEEVSAGTKGSSVVKITEVVQQGTVLGKTMTILVRGSNKLVVEEADRSLHDALCVMRSLVKKRFLICGGAVAEVEIARQLMNWSNELKGQHSFCTKLFAEAFEVVPLTLAENAGLNPIAITTELRRRHKAGEINAGINVRLGEISDMKEEKVLQPLLVSTSIVSLATVINCIHNFPKLFLLKPIFIVKF
jgi:T-complex protein 1 subunit delta